MSNYYITSNELYHFGILGMHWGVRRYQNKDGSLTAAGRERYAKQDVDDLKRVNNSSDYSYESRKKMVRNTHTYKHAREEVLKKIGDSYDFHEIQIASHEEVNKFLGKHKKEVISGQKWTASDEISWEVARDVTNEQGQKNPRIKAIKSEIDSADLLYNSSRDGKSAAQSKRTKQAVDFGMNVFNEETLKRAPYYGDKLDPQNKMDRTVFSMEDWTVGWTTVADLARRGYSKNETLDIIKKCKECAPYYDIDDGLSMHELCDDNGSDVESFANDCYNYLDKQKKINRDKFTRQMNDEAFRRFHEQQML